MRRHFPFYEVKRVFLACPGDLVSERSRFPRVLETVNNLRAHSLGLHLEAIGWERIIPSVGRPQDLINEELSSADLVVVMFWNRVGSPASDRSPKSGTLEEFELARHLYMELTKPVVWVYFRKPTAELDDQLRGVLRFRKELEDGKQMFFREYVAVADWEEMFREHLVAFLDGLHRWGLDRNFEYMRPNLALMKGTFLGEGIYKYGTRLALNADLDGDCSEETVCFWFSAFSHKLTVTRFDSTLHLELPELESARILHLGVKDVTNDGLPEILLAAGDGLTKVELRIWGFNEEGRATRRLVEGNFCLLAKLEGQHHAHIHEGGTILLPYGSQGFALHYRWTGREFELIPD